MLASLAARWHRLTAPLLPDEGRRAAMLEQLVAAYQAPGRHYHTLTHIQALLEATDTAADQLQDAVVVELAVWFHDAVYEPLRSDNEEKSAELAWEFLSVTSLSAARQERVVFLIERTKDHTLPQPPDDADLLFFLDADLSILGAPEARYQEYARQVRQEYRMVPGILYRRGRRKVLEKMLAAPALYRTADYHTRLEAAARRNLQQELREL
ncbi:HD domain-containing protein [Hymenobacter sediminicola]|uniref:Metal-dependent phosphohydrolase n=1 Tax=Hymenobacter sediminicola TaxID=2761579 RepID=A0A7G7W8W4_9BACT|nr:metal-dependent phosphohydrolase [Hymenobacter sediminicola]QNH62807.1 metal-dependent phosphohydrolase [Hymenobacter sediminicola]